MKQQLMETEKKGAFKSPNKKHAFDLIFEGEIRFGPTYYKLKLDGKLIENRVFGFEFIWHPNSTFLALQEWSTIEYKKGPITTLTLVDFQNMKLAKISTAEKGFIKPIKFETNSIIFEKQYLANGKIVEYEINLTEINNWE